MANTTSASGDAETTYKLQRRIEDLQNDINYIAQDRNRAVQAAGAARLAEREANREVGALMDCGHAHCSRAHGCVKHLNEAIDTYKKHIAEIANSRRDLRTRVQELEIDGNDADRLRERLSELLTQTAEALKGPPAPNVLHDWSDLPAVAAGLKARAEEAEEKATQLAAGVAKEWLEGRGAAEVKELDRKLRAAEERAELHAEVADALQFDLQSLKTMHEVQYAIIEKRLQTSNRAQTDARKSANGWRALALENINEVVYWQHCAHCGQRLSAPGSCIFSDLELWQEVVEAEHGR